MAEMQSQFVSGLGHQRLGQCHDFSRGYFRKRKKKVSDNYVLMRPTIVFLWISKICRPSCFCYDCLYSRINGISIAKAPNITQYSILEKALVWSWTEADHNCPFAPKSFLIITMLLKSPWEREMRENEWMLTPILHVSLPLSYIAQFRFWAERERPLHYTFALVVVWGFCLVPSIFLRKQSWFIRGCYVSHGASSFMEIIGLARNGEFMLNIARFFS